MRALYAPPYTCLLSPPHPTPSSFPSTYSLVNATCSLPHLETLPYTTNFYFFSPLGSARKHSYRSVRVSPYTSPGEPEKLESSRLSIPSVRSSPPAGSSRIRVRDGIRWAPPQSGLSAHLPPQQFMSGNWKMLEETRILSVVFDTSAGMLQ
ncbi:unnamed protein product [Pleuronectes platessa]|uniref:Uncharacterized protein n=1 Tax=Pleuronectes platessa TaxID=8262 RepID=A0A9N7TWI0_PLEPL|nr:unnamed protein product [Pleuronectes platessa]